MLNRVSRLVPIEVKVKAYYALIYSKVIYAILSWGKSCLENEVMLETVVKRLWRVI